MCRFSLPNSATWGCTCHLEGDDLPSHEHTLYLTVAIKVEGSPTGDDMRELEENETRPAIYAELIALAEKVAKRERNRLYTHTLSDLFFEIDDDNKDCDCCEELHLAEGRSEYTGPDTREEAEGLR